MKRDVLWLPMPFRRGHWIVERRVPFLFKIMTLELIAEFMKIPLDKLFEPDVVSNDQMNLAMVWCGYQAACRELYRRPRHSLAQATRWNEFMAKSTRDRMMTDVAVLLASMTKDGKGTEPIGGTVKKK